MQAFRLSKIVAYASAHGFSHALVLNEGARGTDSLLVVCLPEGPTARFRVTGVTLASDIRVRAGGGGGQGGTAVRARGTPRWAPQNPLAAIPRPSAPPTPTQGHGRPTPHPPELVLANFTTRLGCRVGRTLASLFPVAPAFRGRQVATFHNQRDFIFFRHHRYVFEEKKAAKAGGKKGDAPATRVVARLQELGPRFTLRLTSLHRGALEGKAAVAEWLPKRHARGSRRRFVL